MSGRFISTGVEGLDAVLGGGFPRDSLIILAGNPGTGKTVFSAQFLYRGAVDYNEKGLYVSFAESRETFFENMRGFGFDFEKLQRDGKFRFLDLLTVKEQAVPSILSIILDEAGRAEAKRLVLDSFSALAQTFKEPIDIRIVVHAILSKIIRMMGCTTIMVEEVPFGSSKIGFGVEEFVADGVIHLRNRELGGYRFRELEILKLRGARLKESRLVFTLDGGFKAFPPFQFRLPEKPKRFQPIPDPSDKYSTGSKSFDKVLNGGLPRGSVMLLELDEKISTSMYHLLVAPMAANFVLQGRGVFVVPSSGVDPALFRKYIGVYGGTEEEWTHSARIIMTTMEGRAEPPAHYSNVIHVKGEDWRDDMSKVLRASEELATQTGQPNLSIVGVDTLVTLYGEKRCEEILNLSATMARTAGSSVIAIVKAGLSSLAVKLSPIADIYLRLTRKRGSPLLYGVKPRTGLYAVELDTSEGYPIPKLTPII
ncbi:AAA family ATPase [Candidatus Bathyarchaeota archaeon]|nr:AAA family ATPase [Candidatus Bathyarchaeota archaeon]